MMHDWSVGWGWAGMWLGPLFWLLLLGFLIAGVLAILRRSGGRDDGRKPRSPTPREILDERFAKGEIDKEEYEDRRKTLGG